MGSHFAVLEDESLSDPSLMSHQTRLRQQLTLLKARLAPCFLNHLLPACLDTSGKLWPLLLLSRLGIKK